MTAPDRNRDRKPFPLLNGLGMNEHNDEEVNRQRYQWAIENRNPNL